MGMDRRLGVAVASVAFLVPVFVLIRIVLRELFERPVDGLSDPFDDLIDEVSAEHPGAVAFLHGDDRGIILAG